MGLGSGCGGLIGGLVYSRAGVQGVFQVAAVIILAGWLLCAALQACIPKQTPPEPEEIVYVVTEATSAAAVGPVAAGEESC